VSSLLSPKVVYFEWMNTNLERRGEAVGMYHIGIDMHKRFSRVEVMSGGCECIL